MRTPSRTHRIVSLTLLALSLAATAAGRQPNTHDGRFFSGEGDSPYLQLLETSRSLFAPNPRLQNLAMLYYPAWNGLVEGPTWDAWWIQNSYGTTLAALPFLQEPFVTFLQNSQDLWFDQMGDGKTERPFSKFKWVPPDGALCDAARPGWFVAKQGDGRVDIHDWGMEFTAAGLLMQSELLLISRDPAAIAHYLPKLERCAHFIETRRDPANNLFLAGPAGNLLAPSFAGWKRPDGTYGQAYLAGLSVTTIAALDRLIELEKLAGRAGMAGLFEKRRDDARSGLRLLLGDDGCFIRSLDPDGTRHGVFGAARHGYFEASPNHDAVALGVVDDATARSIMDRMCGIQGLRPHRFVIPNFPSYDDMYEKPEGLWGFGTWVNGGHWSTCEARMILAYYRLGRFDDARASIQHLLGFAKRFRMDNPLVKFGSDVYQPNQPVNLTYDAFGPAAAFVRGLFEYRYAANRLEIVPHIPPGIQRVEQRFPIRWGTQRIYIACAGQGPVTAVRVNGRTWRRHDDRKITLEPVAGRGMLRVSIGRGGSEPPRIQGSVRPRPRAVPPAEDTFWDLGGLVPAGDAGIRWDAGKARAVGDLLLSLRSAGRGETPEAQHAELVLECIEVARARLILREAGQLDPLAPESQTAADRSYVETVNRLIEGLFSKGPGSHNRH